MQKVDEILDIEDKNLVQNELNKLENENKEYDIFDDIKGVIRKLSTDIRNTYNLDDINPKIIDSYAKLAEVSIKYVELEKKYNNNENINTVNNNNVMPVSLTDMLNEIKNNK